MRWIENEMIGKREGTDCPSHEDLVVTAFNQLFPLTDINGPE